MLAMILSAVTSRLAGPIALAGCAVLGFMLIGAKMETGRVKGDLKAQISESKRLARDLDTCRGNVSRVDAALTTQNAAVAAAKAEGDRMTASATKAASEARSGRNEADKTARRLAVQKPKRRCRRSGRLDFQHILSQTKPAV